MTTRILLGLMASITVYATGENQRSAALCDKCREELEMHGNPEIACMLSNKERFTIITPHRSLQIWASDVFQLLISRCRHLCLMAICTIVVACNPSIAETFPPQDDLCAELGRALTDRERLEKALVYAYADASLSHFQQFKGQLPATDTEAGERAVVDKYLDTFVNCCAVLPPAYLQEEWALPVVQSEAKNGSLEDWNRDVKIARRPEDWGRFDQLKGTPNWHRRMNACGSIEEIDRG